MLKRAAGGLSKLVAARTAPIAGRQSTRVSGELPAALTPGMRVVARLRLANTGTLPWQTRGDQRPIHVGSRWFDEAGSFVADGPRARVWPSLWPGRSRVVELMLDAPPAPGRYELRIAPVRENVAWFDDVDARNGLRAPCEVAPAPAGRATRPDCPGWRR